MHKAIHFLEAPAPPVGPEGQPALMALPPPAWRYAYPNLSDSFVFNYSKLMASGGPLGRQKDPSKAKSVAIIGAGISGTLAFRELARAGYRVDMYESTNRVGGRTWTYRAMGMENGRPVTQLTPFEMGAMRIPFFNTANAVKCGGGPWKGGPYHTDRKQTNSVAEFFAITYGISTASFPDPGKPPGSVPSGCQAGTPGVPSGVYLNSGWGVDLSTSYPSESIPNPTKQFMYSWPVDSKSVLWPDTPNTKVKITWYNRGTAMKDAAPNLMLGHALPDGEPDIPPTFKKTDPDYKDNVNAWRKGVFALRNVQYKWTVFASIVSAVIAGTPLSLDGKPVPLNGAPWTDCRYSSQNWEKYWRESVMPHYQNASFYDVAVAGPILPTKDASGNWIAPKEWAAGNFGGLGMDAAEAQLFYTIGAGDGSWGAFYPNSALWALRALLFGFAKEHQLILGILNDGQTAITDKLDPKPDESYYTPSGEKRKTIRDSIGNQYWAPQYSGVGAFADGHFYTPYAAGKPDSPYTDISRAGTGKRLLTSCKVRAVHFAADKIDITALNTVTNAEIKTTYDYVICTVPIWNTQTDMTFTGFSLKALSPTVSSALSTSHWIRSAKIFLPLNQPYWTQPGDTRPNPPKIPQVIATNTELQDMYGIVAPTGTNPNPVTGGIALISYSWEDGAQKFLPYQEQELAAMLLARLEAVLASSGLPPFRSFLAQPDLKVPGAFAVWRWSLQPSYHGCAKAYQPGIENLNFSLLTYNRDSAPASHLFFSGDAYSLESGWLEPALRLALDATLNLINQDPNCAITTAEGFNFAQDYKTAEPMTLAQAQLTKTLGPCDCVAMPQPKASAPPAKKGKRPRE